MTDIRWQNWTLLIVGFWMVASPWILGFAADAQAAPTAWILGGAIVVLATFAVAAQAMYKRDTWEEGLNALLGLCLIASPWVVGFTDRAAAASNAVIAGLVVMALGVWVVLENTEVQQWWHDHHPQAR